MIIQTTRKQLAKRLASGYWLPVEGQPRLVRQAQDLKGPYGQIRIPAGELLSLQINLTPEEVAEQDRNLWSKK